MSIAFSASGFAESSEQLRRVAHGTPERVVLLADPVFDRARHPELAPLPGSQREAADLCALYPRVEFLLGRDATKENLLRSAPKADVLQISTHARSHPTSALSSYLVLSPAGTGFETDRLSAAEVEKQDLSRIRVAVLSACQTAWSVTGGSDGPDSLTRAFLQAGVPVVIGSLWRVHDDVLPNLLATFHRHLRKGDCPAEALRAAQIEFMGSSAWDVHRSSDWAAIQIFGGIQK